MIVESNIESRFKTRLEKSIRNQNSTRKVDLKSKLDSKVWRFLDESNRLDSNRRVIKNLASYQKSLIYLFDITSSRLEKLSNFYLFHIVLIACCIFRLITWRLYRFVQSHYSIALFYRITLSHYSIIIANL